jgi:hypothetical protein
MINGRVVIPRPIPGLAAPNNGTEEEFIKLKKDVLDGRVTIYKVDTK